MSGASHALAKQSRPSTPVSWLLALLMGLSAIAFDTQSVAEEDVAETQAGEIVAEVGEITEIPITDSDRDHWAFAPIARPDVPVVQNGEAVRSPLDAFVLARLEKKGLSLAREADRQTLLRRVTFDLHGVPPTADELEAFLTDRAPDAYERLVDRLLASPRYGERWGQHWLDLARFAETDGFEHDKVRAEAWRYRDWLIEALNADLPYDTFVARQIAGDLLPADGQVEKSKAAIPTTFCLAGPDMPDQNDQAERRHSLLNDLTSTVGSVLLGLQMGCAQCHDHKYDPVSQADFFRLRAVFESSVPELKRDQPYTSLKEQPKYPAPRLWIRGDHRRPGPELRPAFPRIAYVSSEADDHVSGDEKRNLGRAEFAEWLFDESNPLTARVMANRVWQFHFGRGIFDTPSDVGLINAGPTHPELLDWLACELRDNQWSLKELHRTILCSATYRQASRAGDEGGLAGDSSWAKRIELDPENEWFSRFPRRRLEGEAIRDAMLASAGLLSTECGGPGVMPPLPQELTSTLLKGQWSASKREADHYRRSIYLFTRRNLRYPIFEAFDRPDANASCALRSRSTTAPQSLVLLNGEFSLLAARHLAGRAANASAPDEQVELLFLHTLCRKPTAEERTRFVQFLAKQRATLAEENRPDEELALPIGGLSSDRFAAAALVDASLALLNASEFLYVD